MNELLTNSFIRTTQKESRIAFGDNIVRVDRYIEDEKPDDHDGTFYAYIPDRNKNYLTDDKSLSAIFQMAWSERLMVVRFAGMKFSNDAFERIERALGGTNIHVCDREYKRLAIEWPSTNDISDVIRAWRRGVHPALPELGYQKI